MERKKSKDNEDLDETKVVGAASMNNEVPMGLPNGIPSIDSLRKPPSFVAPVGEMIEDEKKTNVTSHPTISNNHTLYGEISRQDLIDKGKNFDTTDIEIGKTGLKFFSNQPMGSKRGQVNNYSNLDTSKLKAKDNLEDDNTNKTRVNVIRSIKKMMTNGPALTNPDETVRISILNKSSIGDKLKKWSWIFVVIIGFVVLNRVGFFDENKKSREKQELLTGNENVPEEGSDDLRNFSKLMVDYDVVGRGLVYNCRSRSLACTDKQNYINCRKLSKIDKSCVTQGVFDSNAQCMKSMKGRSLAKINQIICE